ncbi:hypothetical protein BYT27DRAFT_7215533 [Phlegmacium glaucopus]|nr:hypothetical protein BYT27DRAFT_7215533 [Phlegmacium glaucopus]
MTRCLKRFLMSGLIYLIKLFVKYVGLASFVVLLWDHVDSFADESFTFFSLCVHAKIPTSESTVHTIPLFPQNRYFTPLAFIINLYVGHLKCSHFVRYEGCTFAIAVEVVGLMMLLRISAIYPKQKWISRGLALILIIETAVNAWLISRGEAVLHNPNSAVHACTMIYEARSGWASASAWIPLFYDTIIFGLTLYRTVPPIRREEAGYIVKRLLEDGLLYYSVIFSVTFVLTFMIVTAPPGTKNIAAQMEQLSREKNLNARLLFNKVAMMSRITINLKRAGDIFRNNTARSSPKTPLFDHRRRRRPSSTQWDHPFNTPDVPRLSTDKMPLPPSPSLIDDMAGRSSFSKASHPDLIHKPPPLVVASDVTARLGSSAAGLGSAFAGSGLLNLRPHKPSSSQLSYGLSSAWA